MNIKSFLMLASILAATQFISAQEENVGGLLKWLEMTNADGVSLTFNDEPNGFSGLYGLHINKPYSLANPHGVSYDVDGIPIWETGVDFENADMVLLYSSVNSAPWGVADVFRVSGDRRFVLGPAVGSPVGWPDQLTVLRGNAMSGIRIAEYSAQMDIADALTLEREGDAGHQWITWTQGNTTTDWRIGEYKNGSSYDFAFFCANGSASTATNPGLQALTITPTGISSPVLAAKNYIDAPYYHWENGIYMTSPGSGVAKLINREGDDFDRLQLGGDNAAYPAIKRDGAGVAIRSADDSADAPISASDATFTGTLRVTSSIPPSSAAATGTPGQFAWDSGYLYLCIATNTWKRVALEAF